MKLESKRTEAMRRIHGLLTGDLSPRDREESDAIFEALCAVTASVFLGSCRAPADKFEEVANVIYRALLEWHEEWKGRQ